MPNPVSALNKIKNMFSPLERTIIAHKMETMPSSQWAAYIKANAPKAAKKEALAIKLDELLARQPKISKQEIVKHIQEKSPKVNVIEKGDMKLNAAESKELDELKQKASKYMFGDDAAITDDEFLRYNALASRYDNSTVSGLNQKSESYFNSARKAKEKGSWSDEFFDNRQGEFYKRRADALNAQPTDVNKAKYGRDDLVLPGGENYKEVILSLPQKPMSFEEWHNYNMPGARNPERYREDYERYLANPDVMSSKETFKSGHYDEPNILAHLRMNERPTAEGGRALFLEELQSDWAQRGRKEGFLTPDLHVERRAEIKAEMDALAKEATAMRERGESPVDIRQRMRQLDDALRDIPTPKGVPAGPYVGDTADWTGLGLKKAIERAVEQGHDSVAWTTGAQQAKRYDLSKDINEVHYSGSNLKAYDHDGNEVVSQTGISAEDLPEYIGKDAAEKLLAQQPQGTLRSLTGQDLQVGGEGMRGYYDQIVPSTANDILKSMGVTERVKPIGIQLGGNNVSEQMGFQITPEIRDYVLNQGLPAFAGGGIVKAVGKGLREMAEQYRLAKDAFLKDSQVKHVVYRGDITPIDEFKGPAFFGSKDVANQFSDPEYMFGSSVLAQGEHPVVTPAYLSIKKPKIFTTDKQYEDYVMDGGKYADIDWAAKGYDGIIYAPKGNILSEDAYYKTFKPNQIKSAIGNKGTFDPNEADILKAEGGEVNMAGGGVVKAAAKGLRGMANRYQLAMKVAQRNAALPVSEGGLGLPPDNTAMDRAKAMLFEGLEYHTTDAKNADDIYEGGFSNISRGQRNFSALGKKYGKDRYYNTGVGNYTSDNPFASEFTSQGDVLADKVMFPLMINKSKHFDYTNPEHVKDLMTPRKAEDYAGDFGIKEMNPSDLKAVQEGQHHVMEDWLTTQNLKKRGYTGTNLREPQKFYGGEGTTTNTFDTRLFRSKFAAFDPMRRNENDILAGVGVGLPVSGVLAEQPLEKAEGGPVHMDEGGLWEGYGAPIERPTQKRQSAYYPQQEQAVRVTPTGDYGNFDSEGSSGSHYKVNTDIDILNKYGFGVTKEGQVFKLPERTYTYEDGYTETVPARKIKRADIIELRARYTTDDGVQYGVGRQPLAKGWSGYRFDPSSQSTIGVNVSPYYKGINYTKNFAEGGAVETDDVDYDELYEFKDYGNRETGEAKGTGALGEIRMPNGRDVMTEYSINVDGREMPSIVEGMHPADVNYIRETGIVPEDAVATAVRSANKREASGQSPFWNKKDEPAFAEGGEVDYDAMYEFR